MKTHTTKIVGIIVLAISLVFGQATAQAASNYTVKSGDTLWEIARDHDVSINNLVDWNQLNSHVIFPSQELKIKDPVKKYIVKKGDTLSEIADKHKLSLNSLMAWNGLSGHLIFPGDELVLEGHSVATSSAPVQKEVQASAPQQAPKATAPVAPQQESKAAAPAPQPKNETQQAPKQQPEVSANPPQESASPAGGKEMSMTATAYTAYCNGCSGITATGIDLRSNPNQKVIAVDPNVIPLGSRVWVEGYGEAIAGDTGGAIKGNIIDVFVQDKQTAQNWGRKTVTIKVLD